MMSPEGAKQVNLNQNEQNLQSPSQEIWDEVEKIIDERGAVGSRKEYKVAWAGVDSNGNPFEPSWVSPVEIFNALWRSHTFILDWLELFVMS